MAALPIFTDVSDSIMLSLDRDGKVQFGPVLQRVLGNPELGYWFGPKQSGSSSQTV